MISTIVKPLSAQMFLLRKPARFGVASFAIASIGPVAGESDTPFRVTTGIRAARARFRVLSEYGCVFSAGFRVESWIPVISPCFSSNPLLSGPSTSRWRGQSGKWYLGSQDWEGFLLFSIGCHRRLERIPGRSACGGSSWEGLRGHARLVLDELGSVACGYNDTWQSDCPRSVVNLNQTVDAPSADNMWTFVGSARDGALLERGRRSLMSIREPSFHHFWT